MSISRGDSSALRTASAVISWNSMRFGDFSFRTSARCQAIASPSRSGSEARITFWRSFFVAEVSSLMVLRRLSTTSYRGLNPDSTSTAISFSGRSRTWPIEARTSKRSPRKRFRVLALAGDSTMIKPSGTALLVIPNQPRLVPSGSGRAILRPLFAATQCPYEAGIVTAHSAVQLQGGQSAEHLGDRQAQLSSQLGGAHGQHVGEVDQQSVAIWRKGKTEPRWSRQGVVQDLFGVAQGRQHVTGVLNQSGTIPDQAMGAHRERREDAARHRHYLFM